MAGSKKKRQQPQGQHRDGSGLTPKQARFVTEYLLDLNATQAAIRAGFSAKAAHVQGARMLRNAKVRAAIDRAQAERAGRVRIEADRVLQEIATLAFSDIGQVLDFTGDVPRLRPAQEIPEAARRAISAVKTRRYTEGRGEDAREVEVVEFKLWDRLGSLRDLGRHLKLFTDQHEHKVSVDLSGLSDEQLLQLETLLRAAESGGGSGGDRATQAAVAAVPGSADGSVPEPGG